MRRSFPWLVAFLAVLALGFVSWRFHQRGVELVKLDARMDQAEKVELQRYNDLRTKWVVAEKARMKAEGALREGKAAAEGAAREAQAKGRLAFDDMRKDPEYAAIWRRQQIRNFVRQYLEAFAAMKLPPEQLDKLKNLLVDRQEARLDAREAAMTAGMSASETTAAVKQSVDAVTDEIKGLIGADAYKQLDQAPQTENIKTWMETSVGVDLAGAGIPFTGDQATQVALSFNDLLKTIKDAGASPAGPPDPQTGLNSFYQALLDKVTPQLSAAQVPIMRQYLQEQIAQSQYYKKRGP